MTKNRRELQSLGAIIAGGLARRMGGVDKICLHLGGRTLFSHIVERLEPQCDGVILNVNGDASRIPGHFPFVRDDLEGHPGPLAGILAALDWTAFHRPSIDWVVSVPGDVPFLPKDLVMRLHGSRTDDADVVVAASGTRIHPIIGLWRVNIRHDLRCAIVDEGLRSLTVAAQRYGAATAYWSNEPFDPFININTKGDLAIAASEHRHHSGTTRLAHKNW